MVYFSPHALFLQAQSQIVTTVKLVGLSLLLNLFIKLIFELSNVTLRLLFQNSVTYFALKIIPPCPTVFNHVLFGLPWPKS